MQPREPGVVRGPGEGPLTLAERMNEEKRGMVWRLRRNVLSLFSQTKKMATPAAIHPLTNLVTLLSITCPTPLNTKHITK